MVAVTLRASAPIRCSLYWRFMLIKDKTDYL